MAKARNSMYHFSVEWGGTRLIFNEITGLEISINVVEYKDGSDPSGNIRKIPGSVQYSNIVFRRNIQKNDNEFYEWIAGIVKGTTDRREVVISLLDLNNKIVRKWSIQNAFPVKLTTPILNATNPQIIVEELEITHDGISIS